MNRSFEVRVPHILQNDLGSLEQIRCGPATIQAILYGRGSDDRFQAGTAMLDASVPVRADQEIIWAQVQDQSTAVAGQEGGVVGTSAACQVRVGTPPLCWATHPRAMERLLQAGIDSGGLRLQGDTRIRSVSIPEAEVPAATIESLEHGTGAAILINRGHWVVAYKTSPRGLTDLEIHFHDPLIAAPTSWLGVSALLAAILDFEGATPGTQVPVVAARAATRGRGVGAAPRLRFGPVAAAARRDLELSTADLRTVLGDDDDRESREDVPRLTPTRVISVRHERNRERDYKIVEFDGQAMVIVDARTQRPQTVVRARESGQALPTILAPDAIRAAVDGRVVRVGDRDIRLSARGLTFEPDLVWRSCDQSRSMFIPFYVARPSLRSGREARVYVRASDAMPFGALTHLV